MPRIGRILRSILFEDWGLKFICLLLAALMWFYIDGELTDQRNFAIGVRPSDLGLPKGYELAQDHPLPRLIVRVRGPRRRLQLMSDGNIAYSFNRKLLENPTAGRNILKVSPSDIEIEGFDVVDVSPNEKESAVDLRETVSRMKPVRVKPVGQPRPGYLVGMTRALPSQVGIEGAVEDIDAIEYVESEDVDVTDADQDIVQDVKIIPYVVVDGRRINFRVNQKVRATVPIHAVEVTRRMSFDVRAMSLEGLAMAVEPRTVEVEVVGEERDLSAPDVMSNIILYVEWPGNWERPKDPTEILGPIPQQVKAIAPPRVQVHGVNGGALPTVEVRGAMAGGFKSLH